AALARTHAAGASGWGAPPPGTSGEGFLGATVLPTPGEPPRSWGVFYAEHRVLPYLRLAVDAGAIDAAGARVVERCADRLTEDAFEADQPALVGDGVARLHGDLWAGNLLWTPVDGRVEAVLIDPAAHGGHAETDLAMLALFGTPHLDELLAGYQEVSPLATGWQQRVGLHQLHPLLVHAALFGGGYGTQAVAAAGRWA
ncbi:fructosamine kinase family protein, partial [Desertihabitans aurantiacus]|uniref:fructosamine kinase family protein n=1 Tax=Desertihabitans aurantiacus TaxID=2282477 RepID=UPI0013007FDE